MIADGPPGATVSTVDPALLPVSAPALVTLPWVRTMPTGLTSSLAGPGTRLCQLGLSGHAGRPRSPNGWHAVVVARTATRDTPTDRRREAMVSRMSVPLKVQDSHSSISVRG